MRTLDFTPPQLPDIPPHAFLTMLDLNDFIAERGGDVNKIKESQRKRFAPEEAVDEVIALYEEARKGTLCSDQGKRAQC